MLRRVSIAASAGIWVGALAGLATALADFGAHWLFMESAEDRAGLLARLLCFLPALGAVLGAGAGSWFALIELRHEFPVRVAGGVGVVVPCGEP